MTPNISRRSLLPGPKDRITACTLVGAQPLDTVGPNRAHKREALSSSSHLLSGVPALGSSWAGLPRCGSTSFWIKSTLWIGGV